MLVRVYKVVVCRIIQENEAKADGKAAHGGACPRESGVGGPGEDEEADGDAPAGDHHGDEAGFGGGLAVVLAAEGKVMGVDERGERGAAEDTDGEGDEHEAGGGGGVAFALLVDDGVAITC